MSTTRPGVVTPTPAVVIPARATRRVVEREARSRKRRLRGGALSAFVAVVVGVLALVLRAATEPAKHAAGPVVRTQQTLLFGILNGSHTEGVLLAADPAAHTASVTLLPSQLIGTVPGRGQMALGRALTLDGDLASATVSDLLHGVTIDGSWFVSGQAFSQLVDGLGGLPLTLNATVTSKGAILAQAGTSATESGQVAFSYSQTQGPEEVEPARLARLQQVIAAMIGAFPQDPAKLAASIGALGAGSTSSESPDRLAGLLEELAKVQNDTSTAAVFSIVPVQPLDAGTSAAAYRIDDDSLSAYLKQNLAASLPDTGTGAATSVFVYNGNGEPNIGSKVRVQLVRHNMRFIGSANEQTFDRATTVVLVKDAAAATIATGRSVAAALGVPASAVQINPHSQDIADVVVLIGADYKG
jgi:anionic cell wall polymer biosynthesis LytR-Cps2A-Psr (LCP) family protein